MDVKAIFDTFVSVVLWITVRLLFVLSIILSLKTHQVDYMNAFFQAPLYDTMYVELSNGFKIPNKVLLLQKLVYMVLDNHH